MRSHEPERQDRRAGAPAVDSMSTPNAAMWDERFRLEGFAYGTEPSRYLVEKLSFLRPGTKALAAADGGGRNAVWLAQHGFWM